jgi:metal-responsive CopG/Arc/MetJ family transcriptional regulator
MTTRTIQMTMDAEMLAAVDQATQELHMTRSALIRAALADYLWQVRVRQLERRHAEGYARIPQQPEEYEPWASEQVWGDP